MKPLEVSPDELSASVPPSETPAQGEASAPPRSLSLRVNFSWTLAGNVVYAGCQWAMLIVLARLGSVETVGQFALGLAVTAPVLMCANLNLRSVQATDARREYSFGDYLSLRIVTTMIALLIIAGLGFLGGYRGATLAVILLLGASKCFEALSDIFYGVLQQNEQMRPIAISMMIKGVLSLAALAICLYFTGSLPWSVLAMCAAWAMVLILYDLPQGMAVARRAESPVRFFSLSSARSRQIAVRLAWLAAPMGLVMFLISFNSNVPRYFVEKQLGLQALGIFAAITYLMTAGNTVVGALGQSATPRLSNLYAAGKRSEFGALLWKLAAVSTVIGLGGLLVAALFGKSVLGLLYGMEYSSHSVLFVALMAVAWVGYLGSVLGYGMSAARCFRVQAPIFFVALIVTLLGCFFLVPRFGLVGAALAMGAGTILQLLAGLIVLIFAVRKENQFEVEGSA